jgi:hypothetical protein
MVGIIASLPTRTSGTPPYGRRGPVRGTAIQPVQNYARGGIGGVGGVGRGNNGTVGGARGGVWGSGAGGWFGGFAGGGSGPSTGTSSKVLSLLWRMTRSKLIVSTVQLSMVCPSTTRSTAGGVPWRIRAWGPRWCEMTIATSFIDVVGAVATGASSEGRRVGEKSGRDATSP